MIRQEEYDALIARLNASENAELKEGLSPIPNGHDLAFHLKRIADYVKHEKQTDVVTRELLELDYTCSLRDANKLMDEQGWK